MKLRLIGTTIAATAALAVPGTASAGKIHGVVVGRDAASTKIAVAGKKGGVARVRVRTLRGLRLGQRVTIRTRRGANGLVARGIKHRGHSGSSWIRGVVMESGSGSLVIASNGAVLHFTTDLTVPVGAAVKVKAKVVGTDLVVRKVKVLDDSADMFKAKGTVAAIADDKSTISITLAGSDTLVTMNVGDVDITGLTVGTVIEAKATIAVDSLGVTTYTLTSWHFEDSVDDGDDQHAGHQDEVEVDGTLSAVDATSVTVSVGNQSIVFAVGDVDVSSFSVGDRVEAKGYVKDGVLTLARLKAEDGDDSDDGDDDDCSGGHDGNDDDNGGHGGGHDGGGDDGPGHD